MKRHYFVSDSLADLKIVEQQLQGAGIATPQIHVLSHDDSGLDEHNLHKVEAVLKKDVVHGTELGAVVGVLGAAIVLGAAWASGLTETYTWVPAVFLAVIVLGFCTWEGGLIGIGETHGEFKRFQDDLDSGRHILFVDVRPDQEVTLRNAAARFASLRDGGEGSATPAMVIHAQTAFQRFMKTAP